MSVFKTTKVGEGLKVQFQASAFNVLNHPNPGYGTNTTGAGYLPNIILDNAGAKATGFADHGDIRLARRVIRGSFDSVLCAGGVNRGDHEAISKAIVCCASFLDVGSFTLTRKV